MFGPALYHICKFMYRYAPDITEIFILNMVGAVYQAENTRICIALN